MLAVIERVNAARPDSQAGVELPDRTNVVEGSAFTEEEGAAVIFEVREIEDDDEDVSDPLASDDDLDSGSWK